MLNLGRARARADYRGRAALMATTFLTSLAGALPAYAATIEVNNTQSYPADGALGSTGSDRVHVGATSEGDLTISGGVDVESSHLMIDTGTATGESSVTLSGAGTTWNLSPTLDRLLEIGAGGDGSGALIIENGASLQVNGLGFSAIGNGSDGRVVIDGAGSLFDAGTPLDIGRDGVSESTVTVSNGGTLKLGGNIRLGDSAGNTARVNIGAASGQAAVAAGIMDVGGISGSIGSGDVVVFNHTDTGYVFTTWLGLDLDLFLENGVTELANAGNSYTGETVLTGGTMRLADGGALGATSRVRMDGGRLELTGTSTFSAAGRLDSDTEFDVSAGETATWSGALSGANGVRKTGTGTLVLTGANSYSGDTRVDQGILAATSNGALGSLGSVLIMDGGGFRFDADFAVDRTVNLNDATNAFDTNGFDGEISGTMSGTGALAKTGAGELYLNGTHSFSGGTVIQGGSLRLSGDSALGSGTLTFDGGTLDASNNIFWVDNDVVIGAGGGTVDTGFLGLTFEGDISGTGTLTKIGFGTLELTGNNTFTGTYRIDSGNLAASTATLSGADVINNSRMTLDDGADATYAGDMSGTGVLRKTGSGMVTLTGTSTYSGGTDIYDDGGLRGTSTSLTGDFNIADGNATLEFDQAANGTFAGDVSGAGSFIKSGAGTLTLTGAFTHTGGISIQAGGLTGTSNVFSGDIANNGTLTFDQAFDGTYAGNVSGTGDFVKAGTGNLTLTGTHSFTGNTAVAGGILSVNGTIGGGTVTIQNGAGLQGTGTLPDVTLAGGAIHAPGNSIGTQTIIGNYDLNGGASLEVETDPSGASDKLMVQGGVTLGGDLQLVPLAGPYENFDYTYIIIDNDAADAVTGTFGTVANPLAFYDASVSYAAGDGNDVELKLTRNALGFPDVAETFNEKSVSATVRTLSGAGGSAIRSRVLGASAAQARALYNSLSGEIFAAMPSMLGDVTRQLRSVLFDRMSLLQGLGGLRQGRQDEAGLTLSGAKLAGFAPLSGATASDAAYLSRRHGGAADSANTPVMSRLGMAPGGLNAANSGVWMQMMGGDTERDGDGNAAPVDVQWRGGIGGADMALTPDFRAGAYGGYAQLEGTQDMRAARAEADTLIAGIYGSYAPGAWRLSATAGYAEYDTESVREITLGTPQSAKASYTDREWTASIETAYRIDMSGAFGVTSSLEPYLGIDGGYTDLGGFTESGAGGANLTRESEDYWQGRAFTGLRAAALFEGENGQSLVPSLRLGAWQRLGQTRDEMQLRMSAASSSFTVRAREEAEQGLELGGGLAFLHESGVSAFVDYGAELASGEDTQTLSFGVRWAF